MLCDYSRVIISAFEKKYFNHEFFTNYDNIRLNNGDKFLSNISLMIITKEFWGQQITIENTANFYHENGGTGCEKTFFGRAFSFEILFLIARGEITRITPIFFILPRGKKEKEHGRRKDSTQRTRMKHDTSMSLIQRERFFVYKERSNLYAFEI